MRCGEGAHTLTDFKSILLRGACGCLEGEESPHDCAGEKWTKSVVGGHLSGGNSSTMTLTMAAAALLAAAAGLMVVSPAAASLALRCLSCWR